MPADTATTSTDLGAAGSAAAVEWGDMLVPPVVSPSLLLLAFVLSVFRPSGRVRRRGRRR